MRLPQIISSITLCRRFALSLALLSLQACSAGAAGREADGVGSTPLAIVSFELHNAHVYIRVQVADSVTGWFILDTGASTTLDSATAASLGRRSSGRETGYGGGEAPVAVRFVDGVQLRLIDATARSVAPVPAQRVAVVDLSAVSQGEGRPIAGR